MASITLYDEHGAEGGTARRINDSYPDLRELKKEIFPGSNWNNEICSFIVHEGKWQFFGGIDYNDWASDPIGPGRYLACEDCGFPSNNASSIRIVEG